MTTATETPVDERVDSSDIDLLDDDKTHCYCCVCFPALKPFDVIVAVCGARVVVNPGQGCSGPCSTCKRLAMAQVCPVHGRVTM